MRTGIFTLLCFVMLGVQDLAWGETSETGSADKVLELRTQVVYPEGRVDVRVEMRITNGPDDFSDSAQLFVKNQKSSEWIRIQGSEQIRFQKIAYTHDLTPGISLRETVTASALGEGFLISKSDLGIQYFDASLKTFHYEYSGIRNQIANEFPGVITGAGALPVKIPALSPRIVEGAYEFQYSLNGETASLTRSDGKRVSFPRRGLGVNPSFKIEEGILTLDGSPRKFDLRMFDAEVAFIGDTEESIWIKTADGDFVDPVDEADRLYPDLVAKERSRIASGNPSGLVEEGSEAALRISRALKVRKSVKLLGPAGSGKTTEMQVLARLVAEGKIPSMPRTAQIRILSLNELAAGTKYVGELETRMSIVMEMARKLKCILLIDEFHVAVGVGVSKGNPTNIAQTLKPALESGELRMVGISTRQEWEHAFANDAAFDQRFEEVSIEAPKGADLLRKVKNSLVLKGIPVPSDAVVERAIELSDRYAITGAQPRKAVNLLLKAAILTEERTSGTMQATDRVSVERAASETYHIDPASFDPAVVYRRLAQMKEVLTSQVVGQREAIDKITQIWFRKLTDVGSDQSAKAILFYGPPGTGKTLTATLSAKAGGYASRRIEMNKYANGDIEAFRYEVFLALRESPNTVMILDEFEKAHPRVQNAVLSMMQPGEFTVNFQDASGRRVFEEVSSKNAIFCLTSNAGQSVVSMPRARTPVGFRTSAVEQANSLPGHLGTPGSLPSLSRDAVVAALVADGISEPVLSRIEAIVPLFRPNADEFRIALSREVDATLRRESDRRRVLFRLNNKEAFLSDLMTRFVPGRSDYREVGYLVRDHLEPLIGQAVIEPGFQGASVVRIDWSSAIDVSRLPTEEPCPFLLMKVNQPLRTLGKS